jgi:GTP diphosphokinase / guanosine-3',5'-bis(diphosphate) 3'-diphosphatase
MAFLAKDKALSIDDLIRTVKDYSPSSKTEMIREAFDLSSKAHKDQKRESGEPYLEHPLRVAHIITKLKLDVPSVVAGLLHDTMEDTGLDQTQIEKQFGPEVARLVDGVTKIGMIEFKTREEKQAENFRKMILSMAEDIRVILIKLADRLHNMRTLKYLSEPKRIRIARETLDIYAPLANRLGIGWMKTELEDLCLQYLKPEVYRELREKVAKRRGSREKYIEELIKTVKKNLDEHAFKSWVVGRPKNIYSIAQKMEHQGIPFEEVYDLAGLRIITDSKMNCYAILGLIHSLWRPVPGRFKDYIGVSKSNGYQSLHTTVAGPEGQHVEFQIRTEEMHKISEEGIAAHWVYKEKGQVNSKANQAFGWLRQMVEWQQELTDSRQFLDSVKLDLFPDVVYVFTPNGEVKELSKGSTPIDFAYSIHTEVGNHCAGAKINGKLVPLRYRMHTGDTVEIITNTHQVPSKDWLKLVRTARAKTKIKHWIKTEERKRGMELGRSLLNRSLQRHGLSPSETLKPENIGKLLKEMGLAAVEDLFVAVGYGRISSQQVINGLQPAKELKEGIAEKFIKRIGLGDKGVRVRGVGDLLIHLSKCCNPVPGDRIIGFITRGRGLSIHTVDCPNIDELDYDKDRLVEVSWETQSSSIHSVKISILTVDRPGMLAAVSTAITSAKANISHADISTTEEQKAYLNFVIDVSDTVHLERVFKQIRTVNGVIQVRRIRRG